MMNRDFQLKLQAYLDGELPPQETEKVIHSLRTDPEALALHEELKLTKSLLQGNELEIKLGESREFYWSKICREIGRDNQRKGSGSLRTAFIVALVRSGRRRGGLIGYLRSSLRQEQLAFTSEAGLCTGNRNSSGGHEFDFFPIGIGGHLSGLGE